MKNKAVAFSSKKDAQKTLDELMQLSTESTVLAKTVAYLASHQADNTNENYKQTLKILSKTILSLSHDIGMMSNRILKMASDIGIMTDRIIKTQNIQSANFKATLKLTHYVMTLTSRQVDASKWLTSTK